MRRYAVPILAAALIFVVAIALKVLDTYGSEAEAMSDYGNWRPSASEIHDKVVAETGYKARSLKFAALFESRFRRHTPPVAVGVRFEPGAPALLMFPARMEPWDMDRIAMMAWREAKADLGKTYDFDLFHTYIGLPRTRIGELRTTGPKSELAMIDYRAWKSRSPIDRRPPITRFMKSQAPITHQLAPLQGPALKPPGEP